MTVKIEFADESKNSEESKIRLTEESKLNAPRLRVEKRDSKFDTHSFQSSIKKIRLIRKNKAFQKRQCMNLTVDLQDMK